MEPLDGLVPSPPPPPARSCPSLPLPHLAWVSRDDASRAGVERLHSTCIIWENGSSPWLRTKGWRNLPRLLWLEHQVGVGDVRLPPSQLHCRVTLPLWAGGGVFAGHGCSSPSWPGLPPFPSRKEGNLRVLHPEKGAQIRVTGREVSRWKHLC